MFRILTREAHITSEGSITHEVRITFRASGTHRSKNKSTSYEVLLFLEVPPGFEPGDRGVADLCLTTWLWHHIQNRSIIPRKAGFVNGFWKILLVCFGVFIGYARFQKAVKGNTPQRRPVSLPLEGKVAAQTGRRMRCVLWGKTFRQAPLRAGGFACLVRRQKRTADPLVTRARYICRLRRQMASFINGIRRR